DAEQSGLNVPRVLAGLDQQVVDAAFDQTVGLRLEMADQLLEGDAASDRNRLGGGADGAGDPAGALGRAEAFGSLSRQLRCFGVDLVRMFRQAVLAQNQGRASKRVRLDDVRPRVEVVDVKLLDQIRTR